MIKIVICVKFYVCVCMLKKNIFSFVLVSFLFYLFFIYLLLIILGLKLVSVYCQGIISKFCLV